MIRRTLSLAIALLSALTFSQLPEFTQQYSQRLGGAIDELTRVVQRFDKDSVAVSEDRKSALERLGRSPDELARRQSAAMSANIARLDALQAQQAEMAIAGPFNRIVAFLSDPDPADRKGDVGFIRARRSGNRRGRGDRGRGLPSRRRPDLDDRPRIPTTTAPFTGALV